MLFYLSFSFTLLKFFLFDGDWIASSFVSTVFYSTVFEFTKECKGLRRNGSSFLIVKTMYYVKICGTWYVVRVTWCVVPQSKEYIFFTLWWYVV